jgi:hypothetical protein
VRGLRMAVAVGMMVLLAACGADDGTQATSEPEETTTDSASESPEETSPLTGTWKTQPISQQDYEATLRRFGLEKYIKRFRPLSPIKSDTVLILHIGEDWDLYGRYNGGPKKEIDYDADYAVRGNKVEVMHSEGSQFHRWSVDGDTLKIEWLRTTLPPYKGIPEEVFQRTLYMTEEFKRQS